MPPFACGLWVLGAENCSAAALSRISARRHSWFAVWPQTNPENAFANCYSCNQISLVSLLLLAVNNGGRQRGEKSDPQNLETKKHENLVFVIFVSNLLLARPRPSQGTPPGNPVTGLRPHIVYPNSYSKFWRCAELTNFEKLCANS